MLLLIHCVLVTLGLSGTFGHNHNAVETETFAIPISPNLFNWTYQEFDQQYRFHAALVGKPELPYWLRYIYSGRHHSGFIFGTPPRGTKSPINIEVIGLNRQDYETRRLFVTLQVRPREVMAKHEVEIKIDNLNVEDLLDEHRMVRLKEIFRNKLWIESKDDLYATFLSSAIDLGARLPLRPNDGEGLVVRLGSSAPFSEEVRRLREEVRPLSRLTNCPREYKRTSVERIFRDAGLTLDWCNFELYNTVYKERTTEHIEYQSDLLPNFVNKGKINANLEKRSGSKDHQKWRAPFKNQLPSRSYLKEFLVAVVLPLILMLVAMTALTAVVCFHYAGIHNHESEYFFDNIFHICIDYKSRRAHQSGKVELCRYEADHSDPGQADNNSSKSLVDNSPNNSLVRPYSPKSTTNLAANYNRPQPPPYMGSNTNSLHNRKSTHTEKTTPSTRGHTPELNRGHIALEESLKLLNEANIASLNYADNITGQILKDPIVDLNDGTEDYVPIKPDGTSYVSLKQNLDVPDLAKFSLASGHPGI